LQSRIPLPTDNIFKFYALFGLLLTIFGFASVLYLNKTTNELIYQSAIDVAELEAIIKKSPVQIAKLDVITKRL
jgi:hypothetical protein